jgi:phosphoribosylglycinamide formyltransferase-1
MIDNRFNIVVCASGGGGNFQSIIDARVDLNIDISLLLVDRVCGAIDKAVRNDIPYVILDHTLDGQNFFNEFCKLMPEKLDLIVLAGFLPILSPQICDKWAGNIINIHPSLLPKFGGRGMYGVRVHEAVMREKEELTGCTVHFVNSSIDNGDIILQKKIRVDYTKTPWELGSLVFQEENHLLVDAIRVIKASRGK